MEIGGENKKLGKFEAIELFKAENYNPKLIFDNKKIVVIEVDTKIEPKIAQRLAMTRRISRIVFFENEKSIDQIKQRFGYVFEKLVPEANGFYYKPCLNPKIITKSFKVKDLKISSIVQNHGFTESLGFRINNFAYCTDVLDFEDLEFKKKVAKIFIHGFLHLVGHDHIKNKDYKKMNKEEIKIYNLIDKKIA